jgi:hypothetical protein
MPFRDQIHSDGIFGFEGAPHLDFLAAISEVKWDGQV